MRALKDAGINIDPRAAFEALKTMGGEGFEKLNSLETLIEGGEGRKNGGDDEKS